LPALELARRAADLEEDHSGFTTVVVSLYEQPGERGGHLIGRTNWRLPPLQRAIRAGRIKPLTEMMRASRWGFYDADEVGRHYAMARYRCFYLQENA
jgi:hypothetical protein